MKAKDLKNSILQMAIKGELVPQDPNDEPASILLERIREEKRKLIAEGKAKFPKGGESIIYIASDGSPYEKRVDAKGRVLGDECIADEVPFDELPEGWAWARLESALVNRDSERIPVSVADREKLAKTYDYYGASGVIDKVDSYLFDKPLLLIGEDGANLLTRAKPVAFLARGKYWVNNHAHVLDGISERYLEYVALFVNSVSLAPYVTGTAQPKMNQAKMGSILIPIPPEDEQDRILSEIDRLTPLVEECGRLEGAREELDAALPGRLRRSVLQAAVRGGLVPQDPSDEPAAALLRRIREERRRLIAEKGMRAPKGGESVIFAGSDGRRYEKRVDAKGRESEPVCIEDEIPFDIPDSWEWARLESVCDLVRGSGIKRSEVTVNGLPCIRYGELYTTYESSIESVASHTSEEVFMRAKKLEPDEVLLALTGENEIDIGKAVFNATSETLAFGGDLLALKGQRLNGGFLSLTINAPMVGLQRTAASTGNIIVHLSATKIANFLLPIPPLNEQKRIVDRVNTVFKTLR